MLRARDTWEKKGEDVYHHPFCAPMPRKKKGNEGHGFHVCLM